MKQNNIETGGANTSEKIKLTEGNCLGKVQNFLKQM